MRISKLFLLQEGLPLVEQVRLIHPYLQIIALDFASLQDPYLLPFAEDLEEVQLVDPLAFLQLERHLLDELRRP